MSVKKEIPFEDDFLVSDDSADNSNQNMNPSDYLVAFSGLTKSYCVGLVDMVDSTKIAATIGNEKIPKYYQIFLTPWQRF
ncbi:MAG: hypothetical protein OEX98_09570 [Nitrosopumilus sp.]|nr:hypothetical protein [Nitrosopumilus sp.]